MKRIMVLVILCIVFPASARIVRKSITETWWGEDVWQIDVQYMLDQYKKLYIGTLYGNAIHKYQWGKRNKEYYIQR
jgi:hypothetical protein